MTAPTETRYRFRDYDCRGCKLPAHISHGYLADLARETLLKRAVAAYGTDDYRDQYAMLVYVAETLAAAEHGLCRGCHEKQLASAAGVALAVCARMAA